MCVAFAWAQATIPNTPAGETLKAWLTAFNSGDRAQMKAFIDKYEPNGSLDQTMEFEVATGRLELVSVDKVEQTHLAFRVRQIATSKTATGELNVSLS